MQNLILKEDIPLILLLGFFLISLASANTFLQLSGDALFISQVGIARLPAMYIISAVVLSLMAFTLIPAIDRMDRIRIYTVTASSVTLALITCRVFMTFNLNWVYYAIYLLTYIFEAVLFLEFWLIAGDLCHTRQAKRIFPLILGASLVSGIITAFLAKLLAPLIHTENMLLISAGLCGLTVILSPMLSKSFSKGVTFSLRQKDAGATRGPFNPLRRIVSASGREPRTNPLTGTSVRRGSTEITSLSRLKLDLKITLESDLVKTISLSFVLCTILSFLLEYEFNQASSMHFTASGRIMTDRLTAFFGQIKGSIAAAAIALQFLFSQRLIRRFGVCQTYLILPVVFFLGFLFIYISRIFQQPAFPQVLFIQSMPFYSTVFARIAHKTVYGSWYRSSSELLYNAISNEKRGRIRAFHATLMEPIGVALAGAVLILARRFSIALALGAGIIYIALVIMRLKKNYLLSLVEMLREKGGGIKDSMSGFFGQYETKEITEYLYKNLEDKDPKLRIFVCELLSGMKDKRIPSLLVSHFSREEDIEVRTKILKTLGEKRYGAAMPVFENALKDEDRGVRRAAVESLGEIGNKDTLALLSPFLEDKDFTIQAKAIISSWKLGCSREEFKRRILSFYESGDNDARFAAIDIAANIPIPESMAYLTGLLSQHEKNDAVAIRLKKEAIKAMAKIQSVESAEFLIMLLKSRDNRLSFLITNALASMAKTALGPIKDALTRADLYTRHFLLRAVEAMPRNAIPRNTIKELIPLDIKECYYYNYLIKKLGEIREERAAILLEDAFREENEKARQNVLSALKLYDNNSERMKLISRNLNHPDGFIRANAIEALENILDPALTSPFIGLLEQGNNFAPQKFNFATMTIPQVLEELLKSRHYWFRLAAIFSIGELKLVEFKEKLLESQKDRDPLFSAIAGEALAKIGNFIR